MKRLLFLLVILAAIFACEEKPKSPVAEYGNAMMNSYQRGKQAGVEESIDAVKKALQAYHAANDKYPQNLEEIKPLFSSEVDLSKYDYNPENGTVALKAN